MFDIFESHEYKPPVFENMQMEISDIDNDISSDIDNLLANRFDSLYLKDVYKKQHIAVEIIYPYHPNAFRKKTQRRMKTNKTGASGYHD